MSVQEILSKETTRWKYKECQEIINSSEATADQKVTAQQRMESIKQWLDQKNNGGTTRATTQSLNPQAQPKVCSCVNLAKIDLDATQIDALTKQAKEHLAIILVQYHVVEEELKLHGLNNPPTVGMFVKLLRDIE
jgi:hypothetical protein